MKRIFIVNPTSGKSKGLEAGQFIKWYCLNKKIKYKLFFTNSVGEATGLAKKYNDDKGAIIYSVGGDGTLNEVINGMAYSNSNLSIIPVGSGNDFYKTVKSTNADKIDLGKVNDRYFINIASLGLDADIAEDANKMKNLKISSNLIYVASLMKNFFKYKGIDISIDNIKKNITILTVCNGKYYGGGFNIAPNAELNDGLFDIFEAPKLNKLETLKLLSKLLKSTHIYDNNVDLYRSDKVIVESPIKLCCNVDGEIIYDTKFNFQLNKSAINLYKDDDLKVLSLLKDKKLIK